MTAPTAQAAGRALTVTDPAVAPKKPTVAAERTTRRQPSSGQATASGRAFVAAHLDDAGSIGRGLAEHLDDPRELAEAARTGLAALADPAYRTGQRLVAPGIGPTLGVRTPLLSAVAAGLRREVRGIGPARLLVVAAALAADEIRELRWLAIHVLGWIVATDPEQAWQVIRRIGRDADDWITVDTLAGVAASGILEEPYRWAELEQLVYSPSRWERRLVGSTIATLPHRGHPSGRSATTVARGLDLVGLLIGDAEPDVQKALSWALRELAKLSPELVAAFCRAEALSAAATADGNRAWVLRDAIAKLPAGDGAAIRATLAGIRRTPGTTSSSIAAVEAAAFLSAGRDPATAGAPAP